MRGRVALATVAAVVAGLVTAVPVTAAPAPVVPGAAPGHIASVLDADRTGLPNPAGLAWSSRSRVLSVLGAPAAGATSGTSTVTGLSAFGRKAWSARIPSSMSDPLLFTFDNARHRLLAVQASQRHLVSVAEGADGSPDPGTTTVSDLGNLSLQSPAGLAVDDAGDVYVLDGSGPRLVRVRPTADGNLALGRVTATDLSWLAGRTVRGLAYDPPSGHFYVMSPGDRLVYEMTRTGQPVGVHDVSAAGLQDPQGMVVAPTADQTDASTATSLFVADTSGQIVETSFAATTAAASSSISSPLVNTVDMAAMSPPSPDPSGLAYLPDSNRLVMTDGEVEETVNGITHFQGANTWELTLAGSVLRTANLSKVAPTTVRMTNEPTGIAWNPNTRHWLVSDDDGQRVYDLNPGADQLIGTTDDTFTYFSTLGANDGDPEGVTYDPVHNRIFVADGVNQEIYEWTPAGTLVNHFDVEAYGALDPESVEYNPDSDTLLVLSNKGNRVIVETARNGAYIRTMDISAAPTVAPAGLAYGPSSTGSGKSYYVVDRGIDNNDDPNIVDGKMFELAAPTPVPPGNNPPSVNAGPDQDLVLPGSATLDATVTDDGQPNPPGSVTTTWSQLSGPGKVTFGDATAVDTTATPSIAGTYVLRLTAYDGQATVTDDVTINVTGRSNIVAVDTRVAASADDAEEQTTGSMSMTSSKLDMMLDVGVTTNTNAMIGVRFLGLGIPSGATVTNAYLQYTAAQVQTDPMAVTVAAQAADTAPALTSTKRSLTSRIRTTATVTWDVPPWVQVNDSGAAQRSPDLTSVLQEVVNRAGWTTTSALALLVTGSGTGIRAARAYDYQAAMAPLLHVEYQAGAPVNTAPQVTIASPTAGATANQGDPVPFQATAQDSEDGNVGASLLWTSSIDGQLGSGPTFSRSTLSAGTHTITATATDIDGAQSSASVTLKVFAPANALLAAGDIADCTSTADEATATILDSAPGTVATVGDNVYPDGTTQQFADCYAPTWGRHKLRTRPTPGNHDYHVAGAADYFAYFGAAAGTAGQGYYSFDVAGWHIVALNSEIPASVGSPQEQWLRADLAAHPASCTAAIWHRPLFTSGVLDGPTPGMKPLWQALYDYGADVILNGHEHNYERFAPQNPNGVADPARGIREFVIGIGGASENGYSFGTPMANSEVRANDVTGVLKLTLKPDGYDWQILGVPGQTFTDSGNASCVGNKAPVVNTGPDQTVTLPSSAILDGTISDDGLPTGATVTSTWSKVSGPGSVTFGDAAAMDTTADFGQAGTYVLRLTADDTALSGTDDVTVTVAPANQAPLVDAGPDQTVTMPDSVTLDASVSDDGLPGGATVTSTWSKVSGPGTVTFGDSHAVDTTAEFGQVGTYQLRLTADDSALSGTDDVTVIVNPRPNAAPVVNAGPDQTVTLPDLATLDGTVSDDGLPTGATLTSTWSKIAGPGTVSFSDSHAVDTTASFSAAGTYVLRLTADDTALTTTDDVTITVDTPVNRTPTVDAGPDQTVTLPDTASLHGTMSDDGLPAGGGLTSDWSTVSGPGTVTFGDASSLDTTATFSTAGTYVLRLTADDTAATAFDELTVTVGPSPPTNAGPLVDAGTDQTVTLPSSAILDGTVTDDGLPAGATVTTSWSKVSGPGSVTFGNAAAVDTTADFGQAGTYVLRLTADDTALTGTDDVTVTVNPRPNTAPVVNAGPDQTVTLPSSATLDGTVTDDGLPTGATLTSTWSKIAGPGTVSFSDSHAVDTIADFGQAGTYVLRLTADDTALTGTDDVTVTVNPRPNAAPVVNAGPDQTVTLPASATLDGSVSDDGLPAGATVTSTWSKVSGPGTVTFGNATAVDTTADFGQAGTYVLRLTADDTALTTTDEVTVTVNPAPPTNQAPVVNAGPDQSLTLPSSAILDGTVTDDGLPAGATVTTSWSKVSGPGSVTFGNAAAVDTTADFDQAGTYVLRLSATDTALTGTDDVTVTVNPKPNTAPVANAGPDQTVTLPASAMLDGTVTDDGLPSGASLTTTWSKVSGPGTVTFGNPTAVDTTADFGQAGTYVLRLTANDSVLTASDDITITTLPPDLIFSDGFESGSMSRWSASTTDGGNLSASTAAALTGTFGMQAIVNDNNPIFVRDDSPTAESRYRARFQLNPHAITMAKNDQYVIFTGLNSSSAVVVQVELRFAGGSYQLRAGQAPDTKAVASTGWFPVTNATHSIELDWQAATAAGANNGTLTIWIDGVQKAAVTGIDNDTRRVETAQLGAVSGIDSGTRGTFYVDAFESRRRTFIGG